MEKWKRLPQVLAMLAICLVLGIWIIVYVRLFIPPDKLADLAYDYNPWGGYTVYLQEGEEYVPYLVVTDHYNGVKPHVLLLRQYALPECMRICWGELSGPNGDLTQTSYYEDSMIDTWLNSSFLSRFSPEVKDAMVYASLEITAGGDEMRKRKTLEIPRRIFLPSCTELGYEDDRVAREGRPLKYFAKADNRTSYMEGESKSVLWWLRTPYVYEYSQTYCYVSDVRVFFMGNTFTPNPIRPAICMDGRTKIMKTEAVIKGQEVYILRFNPS